MLFNSNQSINRFYYFSKKRFLITILLIHAFLSCIYYIHEQIEQPINSNTTKWMNDTFNYRQQQNQDSLNKPIEFIKYILENEYNQTDLKNFYDLVKKEYSLGLKCTRKENVLQAITSSNVTNPFTNKKKKRRTKPSLLFSNQKHSNRRYQRTNLNKYIIDNSNACFNESIDLLIIIISKSDNYKTRDATRRTWASGNNLGKYSSINIKFFFLIDYDEKLSENIRLENELFHDIIQVQLPQQYTLVTHRVLSLIEWSFRYCRNAKYLLKTDDDVFINLIILLKFLSPLLNQPIDNSFLISDMTLYGYPHVNPFVFRYAEDPVLARYIVTNDEYPCEKYPTFLSGFGYLIPKKGRDAILYTAYQDPRPFRLSDVYITGIIPNYLSIPVQPMSNYFIRAEGDCDNFFNNSSAYACAAGSHHGNTTDVFQQFNEHWQLIKDKYNLI